MTEATKIPKIYFGASLFTQGDRDFNAKVVQQIRDKGLGDVYSPAENMALNDKSGYADSIAIYKGDNTYLEESDILIAVLDGDVLDAGLACEIGWFSRLAETTEEPKLIIGLFTDIRQGYVTDEKVQALSNIGESPFLYVNTYVTGAIKSNGTVVNSVEDLLATIEDWNVRVLHID